MTNRLAVEGIEKAWGTRQLLRGVDLTVGDGELVVLLGPSGCGKTTLLRIVAGLERPDDGRVLIDGRDVTSDRPGARGVGMVFQQHGLLPHLTVAGNIAFARRRGRRGGRAPDDRLAEVAMVTGCAELLHRFPGTLSAGERQRVAVARALFRRPGVVLLDEPLSSLDPPVRVALRAEVVRSLRQLGAAALFVTHDHAEAFAVGTRVVVLSDGVVQQDGTPDEVHDTPATLAVVDLLGPTRFNRLPVATRPDGVLVAGPFRMDRPPWLDPARPVTAVIRPSDVRLVGPDDGSPARVLAVEPVDDRVLVTVEVAGVVVRVLAARSQRPVIGGTVGVAVEAMEFFDDADGGRITGTATP